MTWGRIWKDAARATGVLGGGLLSAMAAEGGHIRSVGLESPVGHVGQITGVRVALDTNCSYVVDFGDDYRAGFGDRLDGTDDLITYRVTHRYRAAGRYVITVDGSMPPVSAGGVTNFAIVCLGGPRALAVTVLPAALAPGSGKAPSALGQGRSAPLAAAGPSGPGPGLAPSSSPPAAASGPRPPAASVVDGPGIRRLTAVPSTPAVGQPVTVTVEGTGDCRFWLDLGDSPQPVLVEGALPRVVAAHRYQQTGAVSVTAVGIAPCPGRASASLQVGGTGTPPSAATGAGPGGLGRPRPGVPAPR